MEKIDELIKQLKAKNKELGKVPCSQLDRIKIAENKETIKLAQKIKKQ